MSIRMLLLILLFHGSAAAGIPEEHVKETHEYLRKLQKLGFSGVVLVADGDGARIAEGCGLADRESGTPWSTSTISTVGSLTKQFTAAAILSLKEDGRLTLQGTLDDHFADVPPDKRGITIHQLLTHSSGIVDLEGLGDHDPITRDEFVRRSLAQELAFEPGTDYRYSNTGYSLLGVIIEQVTGENYERYLSERLLIPVGLQETGYVLLDFPPQRIAQGYRDGERWGTVLERPMADDGPYWALRANGGIHSTAEDMAQWGRALLDGRVMSSESRDLYWAAHVDEGGGESFYGYGWVVLEVGGTRILTHDGSNGIHFAEMSIVPETGLVLVMMTNVRAEFPVASSVLDQIGEFLIAGVPFPEIPNPVEREPAELAQLEGEYLLQDGGRIVVSVSEQQLEVTPADQKAFMALLSTRVSDPDRAERFCERLDQVMEAWAAGDVLPLIEAYGQGTRERLETSRAREFAAWTAEHGEFSGHRILGTAFREGRDVTVVRFDFARGHVDRAYVWDPEAEESLLGFSGRGLDPVLHAVPDADGDYRTWDRRSGASRPLRFEYHGDRTTTLELDDLGVEAVRVAGDK